MNKNPLQAFSSIGWTIPNASFNNEVLSFIWLRLFFFVCVTNWDKSRRAEKSNMTGDGAAGHVLWQPAEDSVFVWFGGKEAEDRSYCSLQFPEEGSERQRCWTFLLGTDHGSKLHQMGFRLDIWNNLFTERIIKQ